MYFNFKCLYACIHNHIYISYVCLCACVCSFSVLGTLHVLCGLEICLLRPQKSINFHLISLFLFHFMFISSFIPFQNGWCFHFCCCYFASESESGCGLDSLRSTCVWDESEVNNGSIEIVFLSHYNDFGWSVVGCQFSQSKPSINHLADWLGIFAGSSSFQFLNIFEWHKRRQRNSIWRRPQTHKRKNVGKQKKQNDQLWSVNGCHHFGAVIDV